MVKDCSFGTMEDRMIRDGIVLRAHHKKVRKKCLDKGDDLTLDMAITYGRSYEASMVSLKVIAEEKKDEVINKIERTRPKSQSSWKQRNIQLNVQRSGSSREPPMPCKHCGKAHKAHCGKAHICHSITETLPLLLHLGFLHDFVLCSHTFHKLVLCVPLVYICSILHS